MSQKNDTKLLSKHAKYWTILKILSLLHSWQHLLGVVETVLIFLLQMVNFWQRYEEEFGVVFYLIHDVYFNPRQKQHAVSEWPTANETVHVTCTRNH